MYLDRYKTYKEIDENLLISYNSFISIQIEKKEKNKVINMRNLVLDLLTKLNVQRYLIIFEKNPLKGDWIHAHVLCKDETPHNKWIETYAIILKDRVNNRDIDIKRPIKDRVNILMYMLKTYQYVEERYIVKNNEKLDKWMNEITIEKEKNKDYYKELYLIKRVEDTLFIEDRTWASLPDREKLMVCIHEYLAEQEVVNYDNLIEQIANEYIMYSESLIKEEISYLYDRGDKRVEVINKILKREEVASIKWRNDKKVKLIFIIIWKLKRWWKVEKGFNKYRIWEDLKQKPDSDKEFGILYETILEELTGELKIKVTYKEGKKWFEVLHVGDMLWTSVIKNEKVKLEGLIGAKTMQVIPKNWSETRSLKTNYTGGYITNIVNKILPLLSVKVQNYTHVKCVDKKGLIKDINKLQSQGFVLCPVFLDMQDHIEMSERERSYINYISKRKIWFVWKVDFRLRLYVVGEFSIHSWKMLRYILLNDNVKKPYSVEYIKNFLKSINKYEEYIEYEKIWGENEVNNMKELINKLPKNIEQSKVQYLLWYIRLFYHTKKGRDEIHMPYMIYLDTKNSGAFIYMWLVHDIQLMDWMFEERVFQRFDYYEFVIYEYSLTLKSKEEKEWININIKQLRKAAKLAIMTQLYGVTARTSKTYLRNGMKKENLLSDKLGILFLDKFHKFLFKIFYVKKILDNIRTILMKDKNIVLTLGSLILHIDYKLLERKKNYFKFKDKYRFIVTTSVNINKKDEIKIKNSLIVTIIHSYDAIICRFILKKLWENKVNCISIHDCWGVNLEYKDYLIDCFTIAHYKAMDSINILKIIRNMSPKVKKDLIDFLSKNNKYGLKKELIKDYLNKFKDTNYNFYKWE